MSDIGRQDLFGKLAPLPYQSLQGATTFCKLRGNPYVELVHWLHQILQQPDSDLHRIAAHYGLDAARLQADLAAALEQLPRGAGSVSDLSEHIDHAVERAWVLASLRYDAARIRSAHLLAGLVKTYALRAVLLNISGQFARIVPDQLLEQLPALVAGSPEEAAGAPSQAEPAGRPDGALARYAVDLTEQARAGAIDPVTGREPEIRQVVDILMRRRQNNPLLAGEAGVGKTAIAEGLALRLAQGQVPPALREVRLLLLDLGLLQAGAGAKGEFEARLRAVIDEVQASPRPVVLFIDEIHTLVGAGGAAGTGDAANLLKPALARGQLRTIGATTWSEYKQYIEKDPALARRFQLVQVHEPDEAAAQRMLRGVAGKLAVHHQVLLLDEAVQAAVKLSHRYIPARQLPDKGVALLDTACARVSASQHAMPPALEDALRRAEALALETDILGKEAALGHDAQARLDALAAEREQVQAQVQALQARWQREREVVERIVALGAQLQQQAGASPGDAPADGAARPGDAAQQPDPEALRAQLRQARLDLAALQGEAPLIHPAVDAQSVAAVVADWTGIPVGRMLRDEADAVLNLADTLGRRVIGQDHALRAIGERIQSARALLTDPNKPVGVFLLCGPSGVGKTETALALAEALYGGEQNLITINMSEFQEPHTVSTLKGAPPGYVGYGQGGVLTEAVRRRPYSVVLLDEVEKAHPDVHEIFFQVFDKGWMEDGEGRRIDFRNTVILLTSNVGAERIAGLCADPELVPEPPALARALREPLLQKFPAALLGRLTVVPYYPLSDAMLVRVIELQLARIAQRLSQHHGVALRVQESAMGLIVARCTEVESGGRMVDAILTGSMLPPIGRALLQAAAQGREIGRITVDAPQGEFVFGYD
ncbi:type VI secretion system ATPase TssH [Orrella sp. JC864]|uniref:type VI secretion system ATPase TssH n=1 Tax=Orrella sp. JC864 TaxID=3120298 RepID=UPI003008D79F